MGFFKPHVGYSDCHDESQVSNSQGMCGIAAAKQPVLARGTYYSLDRPLIKCVTIKRVSAFWINMFENWRQDNRIPLALMALMGLLLIVYLYDLAADFNITVPLPLPAASRIEPINPISQWHVFGVYSDNLQDLPQTQLRLTLQGVMLAVNDQGQSFAIISSPSIPATVYRVGDAIPGDATLKQIMKDQVIISYQGVLQSLKLPVDTLVFDSTN